MCELVGFSVATLVALAQLGVGIWYWNMAQEQRRHNILGDCIFMPETVAEHRTLGEAERIDRIGAGGWRMKKPDLHWSRLGCAEPVADNDICGFEMCPLAGFVEGIAEINNLVADAEKRFEVMTKICGIAVECDFHFLLP